MNVTPIKHKNPLPMVPVPEALETVLKETAVAWLWRHRQDQCKASDPYYARRDSESPNASCHTNPLNYTSLIGCISSKDMIAPSPGYPDHNSSIMDGYAIKTSDLIAARNAYNACAGEGSSDNDEGEKRKEDFRLEFVVLKKVYAGDDGDDIVIANSSGQRTAVYVTTGAVVPDGYDAVIPIEDTATLSQSNDSSYENTEVKMHIQPSKLETVLSTKPWTWIRPIGCDIPPNSTVLSRGEIIFPVHIALLTQLGLLHDLEVNSFPRVGILSTGNELIFHSELATASQSHDSTHKVSRRLGKIPDANRPLLLSQLTTYRNCTPVDLGVVTDDDGLDEIALRLDSILWGKKVAESHNDGVADNISNEIDVLITTGGISMGEKDIMESVFQKMGGVVHFGRMNMKPGKPTTFITIDKENRQGKKCRKLVFALPGNPVSASVCAELLVRPCLSLYYSGINRHDSPEILSDFLAPNNGNIGNADMHANSEASLEAILKHAVDNALVHAEVMATLTDDVKLDKGRPEYHRVSLARIPTQYRNDGHSQAYIYHATSTGVQRSSRVLSLKNSHGLMMLPRGGPSGCGKDVAKKGEFFPVLLLSGNWTLLNDSKDTWGIHFKDSMHCGGGLAKTKNRHVSLNLGVILCLSSDDASDDTCGGKTYPETHYVEIFQNIDKILIQSMGGRERAAITGRATCDVPLNSDDNDSFCQKLTALVNGSEMKGTNVIFIIVKKVSQKNTFLENDEPGPIAFRAGLEVSHAVSPILTKKAFAMAMQFRRAAASYNGVAALFENVVGTARGGETILVTCSDLGLEGGVTKISGLLRQLTLSKDKHINHAH